MTITLTVNAITYELQKADSTAPVAYSRVQKFHDRPTTEQFVNKLLTENHGQQNQLKNLLAINSAVGIDISGLLVQGLLSKTLLIIRGSSACGGSASRPPTATAVATEPKITDTIDGSSILSMAMKNYLKQQPQQNISCSPTRSKKTSTLSSSIDYEAVVEIAGTHLNKKQSLQIITKDGKRIKKYATNDHRNQHRSLCTFSYLKNTPVQLNLAIPMKGMSQPMLLPIHDSISVHSKGTRKPVSDNLFIPVKPLQFLTDKQQKHQSDLLQNGWLYIFWQGRLWRELKVSRNGVLQDVDVELHRKINKDQREAEGHWLDAVWIPYHLNGTEQTNIKLAASANQWSWSTIKKFETDAGDFAEQSASLDGLSSYPDENRFNDESHQLGALTSAAVVPKKSQITLARQRRQNIATAYLPKVGAKLKITLKDDLGNILSNVSFDLVFGDQQLSAKTNSQGILEIDIPYDLEESSIQFYRQQSEPLSKHQSPLQKFTLKLNQIAPVDTVAGLQARLNNLGIDAGLVDDICGRKTKTATRIFQTRYQLAIDGISGPRTQSKLLEEHGS